MPSKWAVRKDIPRRSWHSVGPVADSKWSEAMRGKVAYMTSRPAAVAAMRGSVSSVAVSGGGTGSDDSQSRSERI